MLHNLLGEGDFLRRRADAVEVRLPQRFFNACDHYGMHVTQNEGAEGGVVVDKLISIHVPNASALGAVEYQPGFNIADRRMDAARAHTPRLRRRVLHFAPFVPLQYPFWL